MGFTCSDLCRCTRYCCYRADERTSCLFGLSIFSSLPDEEGTSPLLAVLGQRLALALVRAQESERAIFPDVAISALRRHLLMLIESSCQQSQRRYSHSLALHYAYAQRATPLVRTPPRFPQWGQEKRQMFQVQ